MEQLWNRSQPAKVTRTVHNPQAKMGELKESTKYQVILYYYELWLDNTNQQIEATDIWCSILD